MDRIKFTLEEINELDKEINLGCTCNQLSLELLQGFCRTN